MIIEKNLENVSDMMHDIEQHFAYRAKQEQKERILSRDDDTTLFCDREWMMGAVSNLKKMLLTIRIQESVSVLNGNRFSKDT